MSDINDDLKEALVKALEAGITDDTMKSVRTKCQDIVSTIEDDLIYGIKQDLAENLMAWVADMAKRSVTAMLEGNEGEVRRYLSCEVNGYTGRSDYKGWGAGSHRYHSVIHGKLFEQGGVAMRKAIVEAHADLLKNERILDLEDQVKSLVEQVNKANADRDAMWERVRQ